METERQEEFQADKIIVHIPVGGEAKRLRPLTEEISKPCVPFLNRPLLEIPLSDFATKGVRTFIFGAQRYRNFMSLYGYFGNGKKFSGKYDLPRIDIKYQPRMPEDVGSADSLRINMMYYNYLFDESTPIVVFQGDNIFNVRANFREIIRFHRERNALMTLGISYVDAVEEYGAVKFDKDGKIQEFKEKPKKEEAPSNFANTGFYVIDPKIKEIFEREPVRRMIQQKRFDFGKDLIPHLVDGGYAVYSYILKGPWYDVGSIKRYLEATQDILSGKMELDLGEQIKSDERIFIAGISRKSNEARESIVKKYTSGQIKVEAPDLFGKHCQIGTDVKISNSCIGNYVEIMDNCTIENSVIMDRVIVDDSAEIKDSIVGIYCTINSNPHEPTKIYSFSAIGDDTNIGSGTEIFASKIRPHSEITKGKYVNENPYK